jgi:hypothetical protein
LRFGPRIQADGTKVYLATFTGSWATAVYKTVTLAGSTNTASVLNACNEIFEAACERTVAFSKTQGTNVALEIQFHATCTTCHLGIAGLSLAVIPDYQAGQIQVIGHDTTNCLRWYSVTTCT